jgi:hypothetical protein
VCVTARGKPHAVRGPNPQTLHDIAWREPAPIRPSFSLLSALLLCIKKPSSPFSYIFLVHRLWKGTADFRN